MNHDSIFLIGKSHQVCEDYTYSDENMLIVSDGCSSSKDTDIGARILVQSAKKIIRIGEQLSYEDFGNKVITIARLMADTLGVNESCLDATLLIAMKTDKWISVYVYGDGTVISRHRSGIIQNYFFSFESGAPYYLSYWDDQDRIERYKAEFPGRLSNGITDFEYNSKLIYAYPVNHIDNLILSTDGIESFANITTGDTIDKHDVSENLSTFKNAKGEFLKRRVLSATKRYAKDNIHHTDDIGFAAWTRGE